MNVKERQRLHLQGPVPQGSLDSQNAHSLFPKNSQRRSKKRILVGLLFLFVLGSLFSVVGYRVGTTHYRNDLALAQTGMQHLQEAETLVAGLLQNPFDAHRVSQAQQEFTSALQTLTQLNSDLNSVPGFATLLPVYGTRLN